MVQIFCKLCLKSVAAIDWKTHTTQKPHLQQLPCKLVVEGSFNKDKADEVYEYFSKFGGIRGQDVTSDQDKTTIIYRFWDPRTYSEIIHQEHNLFDQKLEVSWYKKSQKGPLEYIVQNEQMRNEKITYRKLSIINSIKEQSSFSDQVTILLNQFEPIRLEMKSNRQIILEELTATLSPNFSHNKIHFFGSSITGLETYDSDVNMFLDGSASLELVRDSISQSESYCDILLKSSTLKFKHRKTQIICRLTTKNEIPVGVSELIKYYLSLDSKLPKLVLLTKFWADCHDLKKSLSSYAISLLVIFYLQQHPYKLPSVFDLQKEVPCDEIDGWNCAFGPVEYRNTKLEEATLFELFTGFITFYGNFDYISHMVSPYHGSATPKSKNLSTNSGFCIQDLFELCDNVCSKVTLPCAGRFSNVCRLSKNFFHSGDLYKLLLDSYDRSVKFDIEVVDESKFKKLISDVLTKVLLCEIEEVKTEEAGVCYVCRGHYNVWDNRIDTMGNIPEHITTNLEKEIFITSSMEKTEEFVWKMILTLKFDESSVAHFEIEVDEGTPILTHIGHFFYVKMRNFLNLDASQSIKVKEEEECEIIETKIEIEDEREIKEEISAEVKVEEETSAPTEGTCLKEDHQDKQEVEEVVSDSVPEEKDNPVEEQPSTSVTSYSEPSEEIEIDPKLPPPYRVMTQDFVPRYKGYVLQKLSEDQPFADQLLTVHDMLQLPHCHLSNNCKIISRDLATSLTPLYLEPEIVLIGSAATNLYIQGSSIDLLIANVESDKSDIEELSKISTTITNAKEFANCVVISGNKIKASVIRCFHKKTRMYCDIRIRDPLALKTTELVDYYVKIDLKVRILIVFVKFWAEQYGINGGKLTRSYMFYLMVIFYLQQEPYNLPSVSTLQKDSSFPINGWNCGFTSKDIENKLQDIDILDLVKGFFKFYAEFDSLSYVISPYYGAPIPKLEFKTPENLPEIFRGYIDKKQELDLTTTHICLQDVFVHSTNIGYMMHVAASMKFVALCKSAFEMMEENEKMLLSNLLRNCTIKKFFEFIIDTPKGIEEEKWIEYVKKTVFSTLTSDLGCILEEDTVPTCVDTVVYICKGYTGNDSESQKEVFINRKNRKRYISVEFTCGRPSNQIAFIVKGASGGPCSWAPLFYTKMMKLLTVEEFDEFYSRVVVTPSTKTSQVVTPSTKTSEEVITPSTKTGEEVVRSSTKINEKVVTSAVSSTDASDAPMGEPEVTSTVSPITCEAVTSTSECEGTVSCTPSEEKPLVTSSPEEVTSTEVNISEKTKQILTNIKGKPTFQEQISLVSKTILRNVDNERRLIMDDLKEVLCKNLHFSKIFCFGSAVTGLFTDTSCVDIHLHETKPRVLKMIENYFANDNKFSEVVYVSDTLKCKHNKTDLSCIIDIKNKTFVYTSQLIEYYLSYHKNLIEVATFIRFWFRCYELEFNNYAIYLMIVFRLQHEPYNLPSVVDLTSKTPQFVDGWNVGFEKTRCKEAVERLKKVSSSDFIQEFFKFYQDFDYLSQVVAPYFGRSIPKTSFVEPVDLPACYYNRDVNFPLVTGFSIQDPFVHDKNVILNVAPTTSAKLTAMCRAALFFMTLGERDLTSKLFTRCFSNASRNSFHIEKKDGISWDEWMSNVKKTMDLLLTKVLCGKIVTCKENIETNLISIFYCCALQCNFWDDRPSVMKNVAFDSSDIDKEIVVSSRLMNDPNRAENIMIYIVLRSSKNRDRVSFTVTRNTQYHITDFLRLSILKALGPFIKKASGIKPPPSFDLSMIKEPYKIMVKGVKRDQLKDAHTYFENFGTLKSMVASEDEENPTVRYNYRQADAYFDVILEDHQFSGKKLKIIPLAPLTGPLPKVKFKDPRLGVIHSLVDCPNFESQLAVLEKTLKVDRTAAEARRKSIYNDLHLALIQQFNAMKIQFFGLDFYGCRSRFFLENVCQDVDSELATLEIIKNLLLRSDSFSDVRVTETQIPLICCKHHKTQTSFDISIHNKLPVKCNDLIKYYLSLDPKLQSLMILIKFWAQCYDLTGPEGFSFYSLCLLVIFYLQHEPFKVPAVFELQKDASPDVIDSWNCAYTEFIDFTSPTLHNSSVSELLAGFFKFYGYFNYVSYVISPYSGHQFKKIRFLKPYCLPEMYKDYVKNNKDLSLDCGICIQAPFELSKNMTTNMSLESAGRFASLCRSAYSLLKTSQNQVLYKLLLYCGIKDNNEFPSFVIEKENGIDDPQWYQSVKSLSLKLLSDIFKCKLSQVASFDSNQSISYACVGQYDIFENRISMWKQISGDDTHDLAKETKITLLVVGDREPEHSWNFLVVLTFAKSPSRVKVTFTKKGGSVSIFHFCQFFSTRLITFLRPKRTNVEVRATTQNIQTAVTISSVVEATNHKTPIGEKNRDFFRISAADAHPSLNQNEEVAKTKKAQALGKDKEVTEVKVEAHQPRDEDKRGTGAKKKTQPSSDKETKVTKTQPFVDGDKEVNKVKVEPHTSRDKDKGGTGTKKNMQPSLDKETNVTTSRDKDKRGTGAKRKTQPSLERERKVTKIKPFVDRDKEVTAVKLESHLSRDKDRGATGAEEKTQPSLDKKTNVTTSREKDKEGTGAKRKIQPSLDKETRVTKTQLFVDEDKEVTVVKVEAHPLRVKDKGGTGAKKKTQPPLAKETKVTKTQPFVDGDMKVTKVKEEAQPSPKKDKAVSPAKQEAQPSVDKEDTKVKEEAPQHLGKNDEVIDICSPLLENSKVSEDGEIIDDEDDDVPSDFFDDFANEDFLEGLDIIDAWDGKTPSEETKKKSSRSSSRSSLKRPKRSKSRSRSRDRSRRDDRKRTFKRSRSRGSSSPRFRKRNIRRRSSSRSNPPRRRSRSKSPRRRSRSKSPRRRSRSKSPRRRSRSKSPRRRSRSNSLRRKSRSNSPRRKLRKLEETKRKSFLEEITEKLNEVKKPTTPPAPVIYNNQFAPVQLVTTPVIPTYDDSFFIGAKFCKPVPAPVPSVPKKTPEVKTEISVENFQKLFHEGKLSLTEFLTMSTTKEATTKSSPLLDKVKVISRCLDIVTSLTEARSKSGLLTVVKSTRPDRPRTKFQSPLRSLAVVRFSYTTPPKNCDDDAFVTTLNNILRKFGLPKIQEEDNEAVEDLVATVLKAVKSDDVTDKDAVVNVLKVSLLGHKLGEDANKIEIGTCTDSIGSCSLGIQVVEDDLENRSLTKSNAASVRAPRGEWRTDVGRERTSKRGRKRRR